MNESTNQRAGRRPILFQLIQQNNQMNESQIEGTTKKTTYF